MAEGKMVNTAAAVVDTVPAAAESVPATAESVPAAAESVPAAVESFLDVSTSVPTPVESVTAESSGNSVTRINFNICSIFDVTNYT